MNASAGGTGVGSSGDRLASSPIVVLILMGSRFLAEYNNMTDGTTVGIHTNTIHQAGCDRRALCVGVEGMADTCKTKQIDRVA